MSLPSMHIHKDKDGKITFKPIIWIGPGDGEESTFIGAYLTMEGHKFKFIFYELFDERLLLLKQQVKIIGEYLRETFDGFNYEQWINSFEYNKELKGDFMRTPLSEIADKIAGAIYTSVAGTPQLDMKILLVSSSCDSIVHIFCSKTTLDTFRKEGLCSQRHRGTGLLRGVTACLGYLSVDKKSENRIPEKRNIMQIDLGQGSNRVSDCVFVVHFYYESFEISFSFVILFR
jgi:hypothetical protein